MTARDIIVIGASAGGVETLTRLCHIFPRHLPAAVFIAIHLPATLPSALPHILQRAGALPARHAVNGEKIHRSQIYIAPPDYHLLLLDGSVHLTKTPRENGYRPAIDALFRSAAREYENRVIGVVLSGMLSDGALGLLAIKQAEGITMVQDPEDALYPSMPENALRITQVDYVLPLDQLAEKMIALVTQPDPIPTSEEDDPMPDLSDDPVQDRQSFENAEDEEQTPRTLLTCPDCGGVLWEIHSEDDPNEPIGYICHTGHRYSVEGMLESQNTAVERALWSAVRALEERAMLTHRLADYSHRQQRQLSENRFREIAMEAEHEANVLKALLQRVGPDIEGQVGNVSLQ